MNIINAISWVIRSLLRFLALWLIDAISLALTAWILPGIDIVSVDGGPRWAVTVAAAFLLGVVNLLIRPFILLLAVPLGFFAVFGVGFLVNAVLILLIARILPGFQVDGLLSAIIAGIVMSAINVIITNVIEVDEEGSFYQGLIERLARAKPFAAASQPGRGLVMMEIDGLSFHHIKKAIADGLMPTLQGMIEGEDGKTPYVLSRVDCGIPSQTSACQAGIMFGDNYDIPAFRWYDKDLGRLIVSGKDAGMLNSRYANGNGLMRGGSSIDNMLNGDAEKSLLTLADLQIADKTQQKRRAEDIYLLMLNPYFLMRTLALFFGTVLRELWEGWQQKRKDVYPRLNRLHGGYPFVRAATSVLVRDISANLTILDIIRGSPSIYVTWPGYDEVAHHSGPWTNDAMGELKRYDHVIARIRRVIAEKAPRPYDLIILSDHGQSFGPTFRQRYGVSLKDFIEQHLPMGVTVSQQMGGDDAGLSMAAISGELESMEEDGMTGRAGGVVVKQGTKALNRAQAKRERAPGDEHTHVTAFGSGNLAQVYFDLYPRKITLSELETAYPGMVQALVQHEGIGVVCGYDDSGVPIVLSKTGRRNLHTGEVEGDDPLKIYAPDGPDAYGAASVETRVWQVRRVMDFPHAGDLMVISSVYPDGTVAALEELIGNHGGLGGEQTDAFIFHPVDMDVPATRNSIDVFHILNNRRQQLEQMPPPSDSPGDGKAVANENAWSLANLGKGLSDVGRWLPLALRSLLLDPWAGQQVVADASLTGPALLLGLLASLLATVFAPEGWSWRTFAGRIVLWLLMTLLLFGAGRLLSRRGAYTTTLRAVGFAFSTYAFLILGIIPMLRPLSLFVTAIVSFFAVWLGVARAHETRGWKTLILPIVAVLVFAIGSFIIAVLLTGVQFTITQLLQRFGV